MPWTSLLLVTLLRAGPIDAPAGSTRWVGSDSSAVVTLPVRNVRAPRAFAASDADTTHLDRRDLDRADAGRAADLGPALPATRVAVNSRGEALFMIRGASERHVRVCLGGIPLTVPWDERADLSLIPLDAVGSVDAARGVRSVLDDPNALAGVVELRPLELGTSGRRTTLRLSVGEAQAREGELVHVGRDAAWSWLAALSARRTDGFLVPADLPSGDHQDGGRLRTNSRFEQAAVLVRLERRVGASRWALLVQGNDGSKGVPPEMHLDEEARFWRLPLVRRGLTGISYRRSGPGGWEVEGALSLDLFQQQIRQYDDDTYSGPSLAPGVDFEDDRDETVYARLLVRRRLGAGSEIGLGATTRATRHRETLVVDGPQLTYSQTLTSLGAEWRGALGAHGRVDAGVAGEIETTPRTADKPARSAITDPVLRLGLERTVGGVGRVQAAVSRRSRFPSLRELYSGALGRFVPNPDLHAERQDLVEAGGSLEASRVRAWATGFATRLEGAIERVTLPERRFQRVNLDEVRTLGLEVGAALQLHRGTTLQGHHTFLHARAHEDGAADAYVEDRPAYLTSITADWIDAGGTGLRLECFVVGPRYSADVNDPDDGLARLPAQVRWNARASYRRFPRRTLLSELEMFVRVDNLLDARVDSQWGLPEPGRMTRAGLRLTLGSS